MKKIAISLCLVGIAAVNAGVVSSSSSSSGSAQGGFLSASGAVQANPILAGAAQVGAGIHQGGADCFGTDTDKWWH